jgi:hypothetical protein
VKDAAIHAAQETDNFVKDVHEKAQGVIEDIRTGDMRSRSLYKEKVYG